MAEKVYLGDAVYAEYDELGRIVLTTSDGRRDTNIIVLEPEVWLALDGFVQSREARGKWNEDSQ